MQLSLLYQVGRRGGIIGDLNRAIPYTGQSLSSNQYWTNVQLYSNILILEATENWMVGRPTNMVTSSKYLVSESR